MLKKIIGIICLGVLVLCGCQKDSDIYAGLTKTNIPNISDSKNLDIVNEYKGHSKNWAAVYMVYKTKAGDKQTSNFLFKFLGKKPDPTGELTYAYDAGKDNTGNGTMTYMEAPTNGIYYAGPLTLRAPLEKDSTIKLQLDWDGGKHSETIDLKQMKK